MDATLALVAQHRAIEGLFDEVAGEGRRRARSSLVSRLAEELIAHLAAEEAVFYPSVRPFLEGLLDPSDLGRDEHLLLRTGLRTVLKTSAGDRAFGERIAALQVLFAEHVRREEGVFFPRVVRALSEAQRDVLGEEILASRPHVWIVTTEGKAPLYAERQWPLRSRVSVLLSAG